jgi:hypothetical protein
MASVSVAAALRQSKFARFDPRIPQVYTHNQGEWGTKAPIPSKLPAKTIVLKSLDSAYNVPNFKIGDYKVRAIERLKEQIPYCVTEDFLPALDSKTLNVSNLSDREFAAWIKSVKPLSSAETSAKLDQKLQALGIYCTAKSKPVQGPSYMKRPLAQSRGTSQAYGSPTGGQKQVVYGRLIKSLNSGNGLVAVAGFIAKQEGLQPKTDHLTKFELNGIEVDQRGRIKLYLRNQESQRNHPFKSTFKEFSSRNYKMDKSLLTSNIESIIKSMPKISKE